ncbi:MAG: L-rhamnose isomerase [Armatimonadetes bacterium]|jgi:L-rhamnose isomerase/sugar isomerase|nr:L-rhamnose isomerase [Armatimonadota bacterium]
MTDKYRIEYDILTEKLAARGVDADKVKARLKSQHIETPSWGFSDAGTRFGTYQQEGSAVTIEEKIADAAQINKFTGVAPTVAVHVLWDFPNGVSDAQALSDYAKSLGVAIGAINPNVFQGREYAFGSITSEDPGVRQQAIDHMLYSVEIGKELGSELLSLWFADGTDYPGQGDFRRRKNYAEESLKTVYKAMPDNMRMLIEYKPFEPGFYHTDLADWGMSYVTAQKCGPNAHVLVDLGHHLQGANIEHIVAFLLDEQRLGGFHFNNHKYADDDLTVGSINPYELFLIYNELVKAENAPNNNPAVAYMIDQCHTTKQKMDAMIQTILHIQTAYAKAMCVDTGKLLEAQKANDIVSAETCMQQAFNTDVEPLLKVVREEMGLDPDPLRAFRASGYWKKVCQERGIRAGTGLGA